ncbi:MAG: putative metal-binding motif-containing protein [Deltaproteobacteria bacterium]|nr:putative metal-binding motif-containing protein [Deltaproteobacteria bacterium]
MRVRSLAWLLFVLSIGCSAANSKDGGGTPAGDDGGGFNLDGDPGGFGDVDPSTLDPFKDNDGDGYLFADDCHDGNPLINPGAYDVPGDGVDNDCNGKVDDEEQCDESLVLTSTNAMDFARGLGLCRVAKAGATGKDKTWGVVSAKLTTTDDSKLPAARQFGLQQQWGTAVKPRGGKNMVVLSTGSARTPGQTGYMKPLNILLTSNTPNKTTPPPGWPRNTAGCPAPLNKTANDSVVLKLTVRVPTNAKSFTFDFDFYTSEYIEYSCSPYNDTYVAILKSKAPLDAKWGGNISFDTKGNPINVNSDFFQVCTPGTSSTGGIKYACPMGRAELKGTGYDDGSGDDQHGATSWLQTRASVVPGEEIEISFMIWNTSDWLLQSAILLDNWQWSAEGTTVPVTDRPK